MTLCSRYTYCLHKWFNLGCEQQFGKGVGLDCRGITLVTNSYSTNKSTSLLLCISLL